MGVLLGLMLVFESWGINLDWAYNAIFLLSFWALFDYVDYYNYHRHGFYLVLNSRINGLRNRELVICAFVVCMHREVDFRRDWKHYQMLIDKKDFEMIKKLSVFVNIA